MRSLTLRSVLALAMVLIAGAVPAWAAGLVQPQTLINIEAAEAAGTIDADAAALEKVHFLFAPEKVDPAFLVRGDMPLKSATMLIHTIMNDEAVSGGTKAVLQGYLDAPFESRNTFVSPSGHFNLTYYTTGGNAVPATDSDSDGTPDFVEWCADYLDYSWAQEVDYAGFQQPGLIGGYYQVSFENMSSYGYTQVTSGTTRIVLHCNFYGFPPNDDPEGDQKGAAKVTCAHEFKHATQYSTSHWTEGNWVEVDAVWAEEWVYPVVNDYHNYLSLINTPLRSPEKSLDYNDAMSFYGKAIWEMYMSQNHGGHEIIVDFWEYRRTHTSMPVVASYNVVLMDWGSSWGQGFSEFTQWNWLTGWKAEPGFSYDDAPDMYPSILYKNNNYLPSGPQTVTVDHLATRLIRAYNIAGESLHPKIIFDGTDNLEWHCMVIIKLLNGTTVLDEVPLAGPDYSGEKTYQYPFSEIDEIGLCTTNSAWSGYGATATYEFQNAQYGGTGVDEIPGYGAMRLDPVFPNPFNPKATIRFELGAEAPVHLTVLAPSGRALRHLISGEIRGAGEHAVSFDGRDDAGQPLPSGVYFAKLNLGGSESQLVKMTLLK